MPAIRDGVGLHCYIVTSLHCYIDCSSRNKELFVLYFDYYCHHADRSYVRTRIRASHASYTLYDVQSVRAIRQEFGIGSQEFEAEFSHHAPGHNVRIYSICVQQVRHFKSYQVPGTRYSYQACSSLCEPVSNVLFSS